MFGLLTTLALTVMATSPAQALPSAQIWPQDCHRSTTIPGGDTCDKLCAREHVSTFQLRHVNPWINEPCTNLIAGNNICIGIVGQDCHDTYVVQYGDTCYGIAGRFNIPVPTLLSNNQNVNEQCTNLYVGEVLCVSGMKYPYNK